MNTSQGDSVLNSQAIGELSKLSADSLGAFRGSEAVKRGVSRNQLAALCAAGVIERVLPDVYCMTVVARSDEQRLRAALLWAGETAVVAGLSAGALDRLEGVRPSRPELVVPDSNHVRSKLVVVHRTNDRAPLMIRRVRGLQVTGVEATLVSLAHVLDGEAFEIACEDARRRKLTTVLALRAYLDRFKRSRLHGCSATRQLVDELDPVFPSRSTLEVKTRRLLVSNGVVGFEREFPLAWNGKRYRFDFGFERERTILETNGKRWHDDPADYEHDNEKWSVPGRHGFRLVLATWEKVTRRPEQLLAELAATMAA